MRKPVKQRTKKRVYYILLIAILAGAFLVRLWPIQSSHWWDEAVYLQHSEVIFSGKSNYDEFSLRPPLLPIIIASGYLIWHHMFMASIIVAIISASGVLFIYLIAERLGGKESGLLAAAFFAFTPFLSMMSHWIMTDMPAVSLLALSFYLLLRANEDRLLWLASGFAFGLAILMRFTSMVILAAIPIYLYLKHGSIRKSIAHASFFCIGLAMPLMPYLAWAQSRFGSALVPFINASSAVGDAAGGPLFYLLHITEAFPVLLLIGVLLCFVFYRPAAKNKAFMAMMLGYSVLFLIYISLTPHKELRYILPVSIAIVILAALGFGSVVRRLGDNWHHPATAVILIGFLFIAQDAFGRLDEPMINREVPDSLAVARILNTLDESSVVYANEDYPVYAYFTNKTIIVPLPATEEFYNSYQAILPYDGYFIHYTSIDKKPDKAWLDKNPLFKEIRQVGNIVIYRYDPENMSSN